jgi:hypothetical protein
MPYLSRLYFRVAALFLIVAIAMGLQMSISGVHNVGGAHAHLSLVGWVSLAIFGTYFAIEPDHAESRLAQVQFWIVTLSTVVMTAALYLLLLGYAGLAPFVAFGSVGYAVGALLFAWIVFADHADLPHRKARLAGH